MTQKPVFSFRIDPNLHQRLKREVKKEELAKFVEEAIDSRLAKKISFEQELISNYKSISKNKKLQKEQEVWDETISDMWRKDNGK